MAKNVKFISIGGGNTISVSRIVAVVTPDSAPAKRLIQESRSKGLLVDATSGKKTRSIFIMDSDHVVISAVSAETVLPRLEENDDEANEG
ncbi:extracellular matrix/biofilm biosynthesis regulator RemA family protein [Planococcus sp. ISL-110]|uniref:extracellular matrix/biofilm biosynthesis regulator RemA family protein n=1 Tax=Planococcus sp. ISL-110 TaxID=2819167 RepID=UPI002034F6A5|nr:extracellular matrix/biofilm biosynthesis regulator RemA family protein [Planococcus sp. ISL-110]